MSDDSSSASSAQKALSMFGIITAAVVSFALQPFLAIADPVALLVVGFLVILAALGLAIQAAVGKLSTVQNIFFEIVMVGASIAMMATVIEAYRDQQSVKATCGRLQHIMLYEHRRRTDIPEIFRSLGCKIQG